jgi:hypothetical protein
MTCCELRAFVERIDSIRDRVLTGGTVAMAVYVLIATAVRHPWELAHELSWPAAIAASIGALHLAVNWLRSAISRR